MQSIFLKTVIVASMSLFLVACGGGSSAPPAPLVSISLTPTQTTVKAASQFSFQAAVQGSTDTAVTWLVNGVAGGDATHGTVSASGIYTAPTLVPTPSVVTVTAMALADARRFATSQVTIVIGVAVMPNISFLHINSSGCPVMQQFSASVTGTQNSSVSWSVNGLNAGDPNMTFGSIDSTGLYSPPNVIPDPRKFCVTATSDADPGQSGLANITISAGGPMVDQARQNSPIFLGTSGGNATDKTGNGCCSGTLGALVTRNGQNYILSNNHVLARSDRAVAGENITQPGLVDNHCAAGGVVANYSESVPLQNSNHLALADAALAEIVPDAVDPDGNILQLGGVNCGLAQPAPPAADIVPAVVGMPVAKSGRSTGLTCAEITEIAVDGVQVEYQNSCGSKSNFSVTFDNQVVIESPTFSDSGDSGSLIVKADTAEPTALLFAGDATTGITVANPIEDALFSLRDSSNQAAPTIVGGNPHPVSACVQTFPFNAGQQKSRPQLSSLTAKAMSQAKAVKGHYLKELTSDPAVLGVGIGAGEKSGEAAIVVFVLKGKPHKPIPASVDGLKVNVKAIGPIRAFAALTCPQGNSSLQP